MWTLRLATLEDVPQIRTLMDRAIRELMQPFLTAAAIDASLELMGLDTQLIIDGTNFAVVESDRIIGCGGWSRRATLFGGDHTAGRSDAMLDPARDAARVRAMYTDPGHVRRGIGRAILGACEVAARAEGFFTEELVATLAGEPLYRACGFTAVEAFEQPTKTGIAVPLVRMTKRL
ncbi:MAG: GNAT family N-acetyltransferase [Deltaproteobacteria bacterium]